MQELIQRIWCMIIYKLHKKYLKQQILIFLNLSSSRYVKKLG